MNQEAPPQKPEQPDIEIVELNPDDWKQLRDLKLASLTEEPVAFEDTQEGKEKYESRSEQEWRDILAGKMSGGREGETAMVFAKDADVLVGMVSAIIQADQNAEAKEALIQHMYVRQDRRGTGIGRQLFSGLVEKLRSRGDLAKLKLEVVESQLPAIKLYKSHGFTEVGRKKDAINRGGKILDEIEMELDLSP
ncbi:MAG: hypothetical protein A3B31_01760 [Candidatus Komeilibacteria bacterium RIFCSPLOWO2_01_FULL_53_11]|uniref:N-acetyltransferase domain-containing protein n=1 Tax=Candidatus Komeilibacteria bacterium RIFCSPLOWO2_01_FULL_53_11 TaxID=1798552 RepID=A0A1G2BRN6_9BACT|nr:MAG: hypothetical protein A3B31_01760 [Candidatus Komeilibacteria bacterium RIFCSPLOWO2_01_FULL_53_11]